jgi:peptidoglycan-N-acetylglucosamine deacetylase
MESLLISIVRALLPIIDKVHKMALGIKPPERKGIFCVEVRRHKGRPVKLEDGCEVKPGDHVIKLHFDNVWINEKPKSSAGSGKRVFPRGFVSYSKEGLQLLAAEVAEGKYGSIVAVYGWTAFYAHARRLGFQVIDLPNTLRIKLARLHVTALMQSHSIPWLKRYSASRRSVEVKAVWFSRAELLRIHGSAS